MDHRCPLNFHEVSYNFYRFVWTEFLPFFSSPLGILLKMHSLY